MLVLDHTAFPHIFSDILDHAPPSAYPALRATCRRLRAWIDPRLFYHLALAQQGDEPFPPSLQVLSAGLRRIPLSAIILKDLTGQVLRLQNVTEPLTHVLDLVISDPNASWTAWQILVEAHAFEEVTIVRLRHLSYVDMDLGYVANLDNLVVFPCSARALQKLASGSELEQILLPNGVKKIVSHVSPTCPLLNFVWWTPPPSAVRYVFILLATEQPLLPREATSLSRRILAVLHHEIMGWSERGHHVEVTIVGLNTANEASSLLQSLRRMLRSDDNSEELIGQLVGGVKLLSKAEYAAQADPIEMDENASAVFRTHY